MKQRKDLLKTGMRKACAAVTMAVALGSFTACDKYDLDEFLPDGWGSSIYTYLDDAGNYTVTTRLIEDLGYKEVLGKTGSKTLFVADDAAYERFFAKNSWHVTCYEQLSPAQKKLLLMGNMINNSYQVHDLASIQGPIEGVSLRRLSSLSPYDTVSVVKKEDLPNMDDTRYNTTWQKFSDRDEIVLMRDQTVKPIIYFIQDAMDNNKITNADYDFLFSKSGENGRKVGDASVNGVDIEKQNIKCSNGFIHKMAEVMVPLDNMADIINNTPEVSTYCKLLERFAVPKYIGREPTRTYNNLYNSDVDSVFEKRYLSEMSQNGVPFNEDDDKKIHHTLLRYDPGWNTWRANAIPNANVAVEKDLAVMLVPTNEAMDNYWKGAGRVLQEQYDDWNNVPNDVIVELINNTQLYSFLSTVPSKFDNVLNDANDPMGLDAGKIQKVIFGCNGAVYVTSELYPPTSFVSVLYPVIINDALRIMKWGIEQNNYKVYLNSLNSTYSLFVPANDAFTYYIDPVSYFPGATPFIWKFSYNEKDAQPVQAMRYHYNMETGTIGEAIDQEPIQDAYLMRSKLKEVLDNHIVVGNVESGYTYYRTKGGQEIKVERAGTNSMTVAGSLALNEKANEGPIAIAQTYNQTKEECGGNGKTYMLNKPIMTTKKSVMDVLEEHPEMDEFRMLLEGSSLVEESHDDRRLCARRNLSVFNTYHYTVYVPSNADIQKLYEDGVIYKWEDVVKAEEEGNETEAEYKRKKNEDFLRYHIQDYALFIGAEPEKDKDTGDWKEEGYETSRINSNDKFDRVYAKLTPTDLTVKTSQNPAALSYVEAHVVKTPGLYNLMAREYQLGGMSYDQDNYGTTLYTSSSAVIHMIDKPLVK